MRPQHPLTLCVFQVVLLNAGRGLSCGAALSCAPPKPSAKLNYFFAGQARHLLSRILSICAVLRGIKRILISSVAFYLQLHGSVVADL
jgi:hypothetical protein